MSNIVWQPVNVKQISRKGGDVFASVGQGRISLSATACELIENIYDYTYVDVQCGKENNRLVKIGLRFCKEKTKTSLNVSRRKYKGQIVDGININSRALISEFFGKTKDNSSSRFAVEKINDTMLAIDITKEL